MLRAQIQRFLVGNAVNTDPKVSCWPNASWSKDALLLDQPAALTQSADASDDALRSHAVLRGLIALTPFSALMTFRCSTSPILFLHIVWDRWSKQTQSPRQRLVLALHFVPVLVLAACMSCRGFASALSVLALPWPFTHGYSSWTWPPAGQGRVERPFSPHTVFRHSCHSGAPCLLSCSCTMCGTSGVSKPSHHSNAWWQISCQRRF